MVGFFACSPMVIGGVAVVSSRAFAVFSSSSLTVGAVPPGFGVCRVFFQEYNVSQVLISDMHVQSLGTLNRPNLKETGNTIHVEDQFWQ